MKLQFKRDEDKKHSVRFKEINNGDRKPHSFYVMREVMTNENDFPQGEATTEIKVELSGNLI